MQIKGKPGNNHTADRTKTAGTTSNYSARPDDQGARLGLQGLARLSQKRSTFSGMFDDDLVGTIR